jgi:phage terminase large subunit
MSYQPTTAMQRVSALTRRIRAVQGGSSASKTISILMYLIARAQMDTERPTTTSIVSESLPHLKRGAIRDFLNIMREHGYFKDERWNMSDFVYTFETGSRIEFFSVDQPDKVRGPRRDRLFINEANNVPLETFDQLSIRTNEFIFLDWNPTNAFWLYTEVCGCANPTTGCTGKQTNIDHIILTYKDNEACPPNIIQDIESRRNRTEWFKVYGLGLLGEVEGKIYTGWQVIDKLPFTATLLRRGLDFGFTHDPTTIVSVYRYDGGFIVDEEFYQKGALNKTIADTLNNLSDPQTLVVGDSAEPKSIEEIKLHGVNIVGIEKSRGETKTETWTKWSINLVQEQKIQVTRRSTHILNEYQNYLWEVDRDGKLIYEAEHTYSHTMDAIRYALVSILKKTKIYHSTASPLAPLAYPEIGL